MNPLLSSAVYGKVGVSEVRASECCLSPPVQGRLKKFLAHLRGHAGKWLEAHSWPSKNIERRFLGTVQHESSNFPAMRILDENL